MKIISCIEIREIESQPKDNLKNKATIQMRIVALFSIKLTEEDFTAHEILKILIVSFVFSVGLRA